MMASGFAGAAERAATERKIDARKTAITDHQNRLGTGIDAIAAALATIDEIIDLPRQAMRQLNGTDSTSEE